MKRTIFALATLVGLFMFSGCAVDGGYGGAYGSAYGEYPTAYYGTTVYPGYVYPYPYHYHYHVHPYDRDHYWDRAHYWDRHHYHGWH